MPKTEAKHCDRRPERSGASILSDDFGVGVILGGKLREARGGSRVEAMREQQSKRPGFSGGA
jgi:hypothetical protein